MGGDRGKCQPIKGARAAWLQLDTGPPDPGKVSGETRGGPHLTTQRGTEGTGADTTLGSPRARASF